MCLLPNRNWKHCSRPNVLKRNCANKRFGRPHCARSCAGSTSPRTWPPRSCSRPSNLQPTNISVTAATRPPPPPNRASKPGVPPSASAVAKATLTGEAQHLALAGDISVSSVSLWLGVLKEERPHEVGGRDAVAADLAAGPTMAATLDGVERDARAILAAGVDVGVRRAIFVMLRIGQAAVLFHPERDGVGDRIVRALGADLKWRAAAVEWDEAVRAAMKDDNGDRPGRPAIGVLRTFDGSNRGDFVSQLATNAVGHHPAIRNSGDKDAPGVHGVVVFELVNQRAEEGNVVHVVLHRVAAAVSGVPRRHAAGASRATRIGHEKTFFVCLGAHAGHPLCAFGALATAMEHEHKG